MIAERDFFSIRAKGGKGDDIQKRRREKSLYFAQVIATGFIF